jgi:polygalacturonase
MNTAIKAGAVLLSALALGLSACDTRPNAPDAASVAAGPAGQVIPTARALAAQPPPTSSIDIGSVGAAGSYTLASGTYTVKGSGADIWGTADGFQFVYEMLTGDGSISARVLSQTNTNAWAKAGVMIRETLAPGSSNAFTALTPSSGALVQARTSTGASSVSIHGPKVAAPYWVRLARAGNVFTGSISPDGLSWSVIGSYTVPMASQVYVGLAVSSHLVGILSTAVIDNVTIAASTPTTWSSTDIGAVGAAGSYTFAGGTYTVKGSGADIWGNADGFQFVYKMLTGDGSISARVLSQTNTNAWAKAGVMIRETLAPGSGNAFTAITPANGSTLQARLATGASAVSTHGPKVAAPYWVRLVRAGNTFTGSISADGLSWSVIGSYTVPMASQVYIGLAVSSHAAGTLSTAVFDNVTISSAAPPPPDTQPPTVPTGLAATTVTASSVTLSWNASSDLPNPGGAGVGGYYVYLNGNTTTPIATVSSGTSTTISGLSAATSYTFQVAAFDLAAPSNVSTPSGALSVTTQALLPPPVSGRDIGAVGAAGSYALAGGTYTVKGSGADIWGTADGFQFVYETLTGDGSISARVLSQTNTNAWAKAGVMVRETLAPGSSNAFTAITPANGSTLQARLATGASAVSTHGPKVAAPYWVRLVRAGNVFTGSISPDGLSWSVIGSYTVPVVSQVYVGLAVSSHLAGTLSTAVLDNVTITAVTPPTPTGPCSPLGFGAVGDGKTDNTTAIQSAINACAGQGGGIVELSVVGSNAVYLTGPITLASHVQLQIDQGVTLQATSDHGRYVGAYINWVYQPNEALISAKGATNVGIIGAGTIDGAGGQLQPNGDPSWWTLAPGLPTSARPWLIEFYQCDHITISGVTLRNAPMWNQALRFSSVITESGVTISAPANSPNTDGVDLVGSSNVTLSDLNISVGDDNIAIKSGLPIDPTDPKQTGLPQMATSQVQVSNITAGEGHGISIGSEASNGVNNVTIQNVHYTYTGNGFRIKTARDRGGQVHDITFKDAVMIGVSIPLMINAYYPALGGPSEPPYQAAQPITPTTPYVHDITIQNLAATGANSRSFIEGLPESCIHNVTLNNVNIQTSAAGVILRHMTGAFTDVTSTPAVPNPPFLVQENVTVTTAGTTPAIPTTPPQGGQTACSAQVVPGP